MTWVLVYIMLTGAGVEAKKISEHDTMNGCFFARQALLLEVSKGNEHFPVNTQALCIRTNNK